MIALLSLAPYLWRKAVGADHIPAADSWAYEKIFESFHFDRTIRLVDWNDINLLGILPVAEAWTTSSASGVLNQPHLLGSFMSAVALLGFRSVLRSLHVPHRIAALILVGTYSGFVGIAGTFQSDAFAVSGAIWAVAFAVKLWARAQAPTELHERDERRRPCARDPAHGAGARGAAAFAAFYGFSVRQQAGISAAVALLVLWACRSRHPLAWKVFDHVSNT